MGQAAGFDWRTADTDKAKKNAATIRKGFAKRANDQQHHENLLKHVEVALEIYHAIPCLMDNHNFRAAMRELEMAMTLSRKRLAP